MSNIFHQSTQQKIDLHNTEDVAYWCQHLDCNKEQLIYCVMKVGNSSHAVRDFWQMNKDRLQRFFHLIWNDK